MTFEKKLEKLNRLQDKIEHLFMEWDKLPVGDKKHHTISQRIQKAIAQKRLILWSIA